MDIDIDGLLMSSSSSSSDEEEEVQRRVNRRPYRMMERAKVDHYDDVDFRKYFRLNKNAFHRLLNLVHDDIEGNPARCVSFGIFIHCCGISFIAPLHFSSRELSAEEKLLAVLRMMAVGNFEQTSADYIGIAQTTMSKILPQVCDAILKHFDTFVHMPRNEQECMQKAAAFAALADFPRCMMLLIARTSKSLHLAAIL